ncbi:membrane frizzled-related protein [Candoia aspera]|uniref:membrane frizzled-related protein n=1 Tax=Candoia aspera TaxID=51853 RepID=UPI002FD854C2
MASTFTGTPLRERLSPAHGTEDEESHAREKTPSPPAGALELSHGGVFAVLGSGASQATKLRKGIEHKSKECPPAMPPANLAARFPGKCKRKCPPQWSSLHFNQADAQDPEGQEQAKNGFAIMGRLECTCLSNMSSPVKMDCAANCSHDKEERFGTQEREKTINLRGPSQHLGILKRRGELLVHAVKETAMLSLPPNLLTEFSNPVFEEDSEALGQNRLENENGSGAKLSANGFGIKRVDVVEGHKYRVPQYKQNKKSKFAQQVQEAASQKFKPDCKFSWLCVAVLSVLLLLLLALLIGILVTYPCGGRLGGPEGSFTSPNYPDPYPPNILCRWHIQVKVGMVIQLQVEALDVEASDLCFYDRLEIYEEPDTTSLWDGSTRYCGTVAPATINTNSNQMQVVFVSDDNIAPSGFTARYRAILPSEKNCSWDEFFCDQGLCLLPAFVCDGHQECQDKRDESNCSTKHTGCGGTLTSLEGQFFSPNYPKPYPHLQICLWHISVPAGHVIQLHFYNFSLESQEDCNFDFVEVYDSAAMGASSIMGRFCNSNPPPVLTSSQHVMTVLFVADEEIVDDGFVAVYRAHNVTERTCGPLEFVCRNGECVARELVCDSWRNCPDGSDEFNCTSISSTPVEASCEPIKVEMCQGLSYNSTSFPNIWLMIPHQQGAEELLQDYMMLRDLACYPHLRLLLCSLFVPKCIPEGGILQPCRSVCLGAEERCREPLTRLDVLWPLNCNILPDSTNPLQCFIP